MSKPDSGAAVGRARLVRRRRAATGWNDDARHRAALRPGRHRPARGIRPRGVRRGSRGVRPPRDRRRARWPPAHRSRRPLARAHDRVERDRGHAPSGCASPAGILLAALRRLAVLAKSAATLDGVVGWPPRPRRGCGLAARGVRSGRSRLRRTRPAARSHPRSVHRALDADDRALPVARARVRPHPHDAEAGAAGRGADLDQRDGERACRRPPVSLRFALDPVGATTRCEIETIDRDDARPHRGRGCRTRRLAGGGQPARLQGRTTAPSTSSARWKRYPRSWPRPATDLRVRCPAA